MECEPLAHAQGLFGDHPCSFYARFVFVSGSNELSPKGTNCAPPTYVGKVSSSARESSSQHTGAGVGPPGTITRRVTIRNTTV